MRDPGERVRTDCVINMKDANLTESSLKAGRALNLEGSEVLVLIKVGTIMEAIVRYSMR
jgi:hypothetical protein